MDKRKLKNKYDRKNIFTQKAMMLASFYNKNNLFIKQFITSGVCIIYNNILFIYGQNFIVKYVRSQVVL